MAILNGILKKLNGSAGSLTFKQMGSKTVVSEKVTQVKKSKTTGQMRQRMKWGNIVAMYKGISPLINYGFENKASGVSDFNMFMKVNLYSTPVYLTREEVAGGGCVAVAYQLTQGSLPVIVTSGEGDDVVTDIVLGSLTISADTTVAEFSKAVVDNNADYDYGDQISFFSIVQKVNKVTDIPYCQFEGTLVVLDKLSEVKLWEMVNRHGFASVDGKLGHTEGDGNGVFCWVHSRKSNGKTLVSTQMLIDNNAEMLANYTGDEAYKRAVATYGGETTTFLTPDGTTTVGSGADTGNDNGGSGSSGGGADNTDENGDGDMGA